MKALITGTSAGIGRACAELFCSADGMYTLRYRAGIDCSRRIRAFRRRRARPRGVSRRPRADVIVNNAGVQGADDIAVNLQGTINITEAYAFVGDFPAAKPAPWIRSVVNVGSASGHTGSEFPEYAASKGGILSYTKNVANRLAPQGICNSVDPGGVLTELNRPVMDDAAMWERIMQLTPLRRWAEPDEIAEWVYFVGVTNRFMTGQNLLIDGGEAAPPNSYGPKTSRTRTKRKGSLCRLE